jgi:hypothetical protein
LPDTQPPESSQFIFEFRGLANLGRGRTEGSVVTKHATTVAAEVDDLASWGEEVDEYQRTRQKVRRLTGYVASLNIGDW